MDRKTARQELEQMRKYRDTHFEARLTEIYKPHRIYPDEVRVEVTYNGEQWHSFPLNRREVTALCKVLTAYLSDHPEDQS